MRYEHIPRPEVEHHHHIRELIEAQDKRASDRNYHRNKEKDREEREQLIKSTKEQDLKSLWCETCKLDFLGESAKEVEIDWSCPSQSIAFYKTKCFKGHWCMRLITDTHKDSFWTKSKRVQSDRGQHSLDTIQPHETNYELLYSKKRV